MWASSRFDCDECRIVIRRGLNDHCEIRSDAELFSFVYVLPVEFSLRVVIFCHIHGDHWPKKPGKVGNLHQLRQSQCSTVVLTLL